MWNEFIYYAGLRCIYFIWIVSIFVLHSVLPLHFPKNFCIFLCTFPVSVQSTPFLHGSKVKLWDNPSNAQFMPYSKVRSKSLHLTSNPVFIVNRTIFVTLTFPSINSLLLPLLYFYKGWWHSNIKSRSLIILTFRTHTHHAAYSRYTSPVAVLSKTCGLHLLRRHRSWFEYSAVLGCLYFLSKTTAKAA